MRSSQPSELTQKIESQKIRLQIHKIIFDADTPISRGFDIALLVAILLSILGMMLESVPEISEKWHDELVLFDWVLTIAFSIEYILRIWTTGNPKRYILSFYGIVDLLSILPTYLAFFFVGAQSLSVIRAVRLLRVFRILKLVQFVGEANNLIRAVKASANKIIVFLAFVLIISTIVGTVMFLVEGGENGFTSIPRSIYWAVVTLTTVGYGDISPATPLGQFLSVILMILGYGVIAVPTGLVTADAIKNSVKDTIKETSVNIISCPNCNSEKNSKSAKYCSECGTYLY